MDRRQCWTRAAKENNITVRVTYYVPCDDPNSEAFMRLGNVVDIDIMY